MKQTDIDRLKEICEKEGFDFQIESHAYEFFHISKKDLWYGVEFARYVGVDSDRYTNGKIYPGVIKNAHFFTKFDDNLSGKNAMHKEFMFPSTEQAYFEQLKKEAFERFGEINDGDRFELFYGNIIDIKLSDIHDFDYCKETDTLTLWGFPLYKNGKWAKKLPEKMKIKADGGSIALMCFYFKWGKKELNAMKKIGFAKINEHLAKCLEDKLNEQ